MTSKADGRSLFRDYGPIVLFAATTIGGMVFIWSAKLSGWSIGIVTAVPLVLMAIYFLASVLLAGFRLHNEQAGDNLYYMGFLFTLSSLGVSLYLFAGETSIETIVQNFGIAVTSTIAGVTLRILFNQMRRDPMDIERSVRHELAEMTRRVRTELDTSSREFSNYRRVSNQMLAEGFEEITRQAEKNGEEIRKSIEALSKEAVTPIQEAANRLSVVIETFGASIEGVGSRIDGIRAPSDMIRSELVPAIEAIKAMTEAHLKRMEEDRDRGRAQAVTIEDALKEPLSGIDHKLDRIAQALEREARGGGAPAIVPVRVPLPGADRATEAEAAARDTKRRWFRWMFRQPSARS